MNTDNSLHRFRLCLCALVLALAGCNDHELPDVPSPNTEPAGLRFAVTPMGATTRVSYDGVESMFEDNDNVGCIITVNGQYAANSKWHYCASTGMLIFDGIWVNNNNTFSFANHDNNDLLARASTSYEAGTDGFLTLKQNGTYNFYFYYPYLTGEMIRADVTTVLNAYKADNSLVFYQELQLPNIATNSNLSFKNQYGNNVPLDTSNIIDFIIASYPTGEVRESAGAADWQNPASYAWTAYPCFVNHTQTSKAQINNSDFLWVSREDIASASSQRVNLQFKKKMATIEVDSDIQLNDIYFAANKANTLLRGNIINLATGTLTAYDDPDPNYEPSVQKKNKYFKTDEHIIPCYRNQNIDEGINYYRIVLPYQPTFACNLCFTLEGKSYTIDLSTNIPSLEEGHLYTIHINQAGETTFDIVDWENDKFEILDPDTDLEDVPNP